MRPSLPDSGMQGVVEDEEGQGEMTWVRVEVALVSYLQNLLPPKPRNGRTPRRQRQINFAKSEVQPQREIGLTRFNQVESGQSISKL